jgi:probable HAF family extracellular repeat protein
MAQSVNDEGDVVGQSTTAAGAYHPFLWSPSAAMTDLGTFGVQGFQSAVANGVNDDEEVVGTVSTVGAGGSIQLPFAWSPTGGPAILPAYQSGGGGEPAYTSASANAVNGCGEVVGESETDSGTAIDVVIWQTGSPGHSSPRWWDGHGPCHDRPGH